MSVQSSHHNSSALCNSNKSKKSKNDILRAAVGLYLKQKSFVGTDKFRKSELTLVQNKNSFILQKMIDADTQSGNSFLFSNVLCLTNNYSMVDQQFTRFSQFVECQPEEVRIELKRFYAPILCHLYFELIKSRETKAAVDFLRKFSHLVAAVETYEAPFPTKINGCSIPTADVNVDAGWQHLNIRFCRESFAEDDPELDFFMRLIQKMSGCQKIETLESDPNVAQLRSSKYEIHTTESVVNVLNSFLEKRGHVLILNLVYTWIHVHIIDNEVKNLYEDIFLMQEEPQEDDETSVLRSKSQSSFSEKLSNKRVAEEPAEGHIKTEMNETSSTSPLIKDSEQNVKDCLKTLKDTRDYMLKTPLEFPRVVKIADKNQGLTSASLDPMECHLIAGFNNSVIQLWQMSQHKSKGKNVYKRLYSARCCWDLNSCYEEIEDEVDEDVKEQLRMRDLEEDYHKLTYYERKYDDNSYNAFGGVSLRGHGAGVTDVRFSKRCPIIYSTSKDATMRCWRAERLQCLEIYRGHRHPIWCIDESPVGMYAATGSKDLTARLWSLERKFPLITFAGHTQDVECLAFHPNGNYVATGSADFSVRLWCVTSGKLMRVFSDCKQPVCSIAFSPDGKVLASGGEESKVRLFDLAAGSQLNELKDHTSTVTSIAWSSNGRHLLSGCRDGTLRVWDAKKLTPMTENSSTSSSSSSSTSTMNRVITLPTNCKRLVKVTFGNLDNISCLGS